MIFFEIAKQYLELGFTHVIPLGFDHILFIVSIYLLNPYIKSVVLQCSVFTIAHSISLGLTALDWIIPNTDIIEPLIALSILFMAVQIITRNHNNTSQYFIIFLFGTVHGMGFASALKEIGIPRENFLNALFSFNVGVELGQIIVIMLAYFTLGIWLRGKNWYRERVVLPLSSLIGCIALYWTLERIL
ncbi:MAG TPA: HupE/UreJ family protein [Saprospiraceae bacterium]|nr:HupE/UreJ family protein [Saprospiraceae bacterium]